MFAGRNPAFRLPRTVRVSCLNGLPAVFGERQAIVLHAAGHRASSRRAARLLAARLQVLNIMQTSHAAYCTFLVGASRRSPILRVPVNVMLVQSTRTATLLGAVIAAASSRDGSVVASAASSSFFDLPEKVDAGFWQRSQAVLGDTAPFARLLHKGDRTGQLSMAIVGGSTSQGGGCRRCGPAHRGSPPGTCGPCYFSVLASWFAKRGVKLDITNAGKGATGPDYAFMCMDNLLGSKLYDFAIVEFAINAGYGDVCGSSAGVKLELLIRRLATVAKAIIFLNTYSISHFLDASHCIEHLARYYSIPSLSWKHALYPMVRDGQVNISSVFEPPIWHHPNVAGHRHLGAIVAKYLEGAEAAAAILKRPAITAPLTATTKAKLRKPKARPPKSSYTWFGRRLGSNGHRRYWSQLSRRPPLPPLFIGPSTESSSVPRPSPRCIHSVGALVGQEHASGSGWQPEAHGRWWAANATNATLSVTFECAADGCGLLVGVTESYMPLGILDLFLDGTLAAGGVRMTNPGWAARANAPGGKDKQTTNRYVEAAAPGLGNPHSLSQGHHVLKIVCRGVTPPEVRDLPRFAYAPNEVHVRGLVVLYEQLPFSVPRNIG